MSPCVDTDYILICTLFTYPHMTRKHWRIKEYCVRVKTYSVPTKFSRCVLYSDIMAVRIEDNLARAGAEIPLPH